jgi:hypothetical protein
MTVGMPAGDGQSEQVQIPVAVGPEIDASWLLDQPSALPPSVLQALERAGHRVHQDRRYVPIDLDDGRRVVLPVDQVEVQYVGHRGFQ